MKIAVYAIAKNEARHVQRFMDSVADADLVIVADTGSTDDTVSLLRAAGAEVHEISVVPWRFDTARNMSMDLVPEDVDLCFCLDLDEIPLDDWRADIEACWRPGVTRMSFDFIWGLEADGSYGNSFKQYKLHARHGYRWRNIVHEVLEPTGYDLVAHTNMRVLHLQDLSKPRTQYLPLLEIATAEDPAAFQLACWLGREYMMAGRYEEAIAEFERYLTIPGATWQAERSAVLRYLSACWAERGNDACALELLRSACHEAPSEREPWVALAQACHDRGLWQEGLDAAERALTIVERPRHYLVKNESWRERPSDLAAVCAWHLGQTALARQHVIAALAEAPDDARLVANAHAMGVGNVQKVERASLAALAPAADDALERPFLVAVTMTGNASELIGDAIASVVDWVDVCLVLDTGVTDETLSIARAAAGEKYREACFTWVNDFAAARNAALDAATDLGAAWAIMLDTDERIVPGAALDDLRATLQTSEASLLLVEHISGHYAKERIFRLPRQGQYVGPTHEAFIHAPSRERLPGMRFAEVDKTPEQYHAKFERDKAILMRHVEEHPDDPRWHYYLGDTLKNLGEYEAAIAAYERCHVLPGWDEQAAWAAYKAAECAIVLGRFDSAIGWCARGLSRHAGIAELAWLAAYASWQAGRPAQAAAWAWMAIPAGVLGNAASLPERTGFRHPPGLYEGPYDVLRFALRALGDDAGADEAERMYQVALGARLAATGGS